MTAETMQTSRKGVFAVGDIVSGGATVIIAMWERRSAAKKIDDYLHNEQDETAEDI